MLALSSIYFYQNRDFKVALLFEISKLDVFFPGLLKSIFHNLGSQNFQKKLVGRQDQSIA
jgi:hypothetical protein